jgi:hypothetical protein
VHELARGLVGLAMVGSLLWAGGAASAEAAPPASRSAEPRPVAPKADGGRDLRIRDIAASLGVSPERLNIACEDDDRVHVYWNGSQVTSWWDAECALINWVASLF